MVMVVPFYIIGHSVIITILVQIIGHSVTIGIYREQSKISFLFVDIVQTVVIGIHSARRNISQGSLGLYIIGDTIIIAIDIQIIGDTIPIGIGWICSRIVIPVQVQVLKAIQDAILIGIQIYHSDRIYDNPNASSTTISLVVANGICKLIRTHKIWIGCIGQGIIGKIIGCSVVINDHCPIWWNGGHKSTDDRTVIIVRQNIDYYFLALQGNHGIIKGIHYR